MVEATNWSRAHSEIGSSLLNVTRYYEEQYGKEGGSNRFAKLFTEARTIADALEHQRASVESTSTNSLGDIDPVTGLPLKAEKMQ
jgi:hypothetical protein